MAKIVRSVNLTATFAELKEGETIEIDLLDATEHNVRQSASRFSREQKVELRVSVLRGARSATVTRIS